MHMDMDIYYIYSARERANEKRSRRRSNSVEQREVRGALVLEKESF